MLSKLKISLAKITKCTHEIEAEGFYVKIIIMIPLNFIQENQYYVMVSSDGLHLMSLIMTP
jgi:hypothetical protein